MTDDAPKPDVPADKSAKSDDLPPPPPGAVDADPVEATDPVNEHGALDAGAAGPGHAAMAPPSPGFAGFGDFDAGDLLDDDVPTRASLTGLVSGVVAIGSGLLGGAVVLSTVRARPDVTGPGEAGLDASTFGIGVGAAAVLLLIAVLGAIMARPGRGKEELVTWPGVVGILSTAVLIPTGLGEEKANHSWVAYSVGGLIVVLAFLGYAVSRRAAFVVTAIVGLGILYIVGYGDLLGDSLGDGHPAVLAAALIGTFVVVITLLGWLLPTRSTTGVAVGTFGAVAINGVLVTMLVIRAFAQFFGGFFAGMVSEMAGEGSASGDATYEGSKVVGFDDLGFSAADVWWVVAVAGILVALWALAAAITGHSGFSILAISTAVTVIPLAAAALAITKPSVWEAVAAGAGGVLLLGAAALARSAKPAKVPTTATPAA